MDLLVLELWLDLRTWNALLAVSEQCVANLVHGVLLLYLVVSSATRTLAIGSCKSEKRSAKLHLHVAVSAAAINFKPFGILFI